MSSFESFTCREKYGLLGWVTRTSRPSIARISTSSGRLTDRKLHAHPGRREAACRALGEAESCGASSPVWGRRGAKRACEVEGEDHGNDRWHVAGARRGVTHHAARVGARAR